MPVPVMIGLLALLVALVLYSLGTWGAYRRRHLERRDLVYLWVGFAFDVVATTMMAVQYGGLDLRPGTPLLHTTLALLAMLAMALGAAAFTWAYAKRDASTGVSVSRWVPVAWLLWMGVFVWAMIDRAPRG